MILANMKSLTIPEGKVKQISCNDNILWKVVEDVVETIKNLLPTATNTDRKTIFGGDYNGDGVNDEWRVAYKSIERYQCIIQNRWGRTVFKSTDPGKGWDGTIGGRLAAEGTYYYVIVAYGTDKFPETHRKAGQQTKYKLSGDINLFR